MDYKITFHTVNNQNFVIIDWDTNGIGEEYNTSPNGELFITCGDVSTENTDKMCVFVFNRDTVLYNKVYTNTCVPETENYYVFDDGKSIVVTEEFWVYLDSNGEQIAKKKISYEKCGIEKTVFWCVGENEDGDSCISVVDLLAAKVVIKKLSSVDQFEIQNGKLWGVGENTDGDTVLFIMDLNSLKFVQKKIENLYEDDKDKETQYAYEATVISTGDCVAVLYENGVDSKGIDWTGKNTTLSNEVLDLVKNEQTRQKELAVQQSLEHAKSQYEYWENRLMTSLSERKDQLEIEKARHEKERWKTKLIEYGIRVEEKMEPPQIKEQVNPPINSTPKQRLISRLFKK